MSDKESGGAKIRRRTSQCGYCNQEIQGDVMKPEGKEPMHPDCWTKWVEEQ